MLLFCFSIVHLSSTWCPLLGTVCKENWLSIWPVQEDTMCWIFTSVTTRPISPASVSALIISLPLSMRVEICAFSSILRSHNSPAFSKSWLRTASLFSIAICLSSFSSSLASSENCAWQSRTQEPASSIKSIALSGKNQSLMNWYDSWAATTKASSVYQSLWYISYRSWSPF